MKPPEEIFLAFILSCAYCAGVSYGFFLAWFRFPQVQAKYIERNEKYIKSRWSFAYFANVWLRHWSYKWFARFVSIVLLLLGIAAVILSLSELLTLF